MFTLTKSSWLSLSLHPSRMLIFNFKWIPIFVIDNEMKKVSSRLKSRYLISFENIFSFF